MGYKTHKRMGEALLRVKVPTMERVVLLDMALAVQDGSLVYSWGHDRLALAIGKEPGTPAAKQALSGRILPRLIERGLIHKTSEAHRGRHAEYVLSVLSDRGMGNGLEAERVTVSTGMGNAQTVTPLPTPLPKSTDVLKPPSRGRRENASASPRQLAFIADLTHALGYEFPSVESHDHADGLIREYWREMERRRAEGEPLDGSITDLSPAGQRYARRHGLTFTTREETRA